MKQYLAVAAIVFASTGFGWSQSTTCGDVINDASASCPSVLDPSVGGTVNSGVSGSVSGTVGSPGSAIDSGTTTAIPGSAGSVQGAQQPQGIAPLDIPNDPMNRSSTTGAGNVPATGNTGGAVPYSNPGVSQGGSGISSPSIN